MEQRSAATLGVAAGVALATVLLARMDLALAAACAGAATLAAACGPAFRPGLAALPALLAAMPQPPPIVAELPVGPVRVAGTVTALRDDPLAGAQALLLQTRGGRIWLHCPDDLEALPGDHLAAIARACPAAVPGEPGSLQAAGDACRLAAGPWSLPRACTAVRRAVEQQLLALVPGEHGAVLTTLVLGNGTRLPDDVVAAHRATGLSHLLAVSGAHAAMLAWLLGLQPFGGRRRPVGTCHLIGAMASLCAYGAITGMEPPVLRALCSYLLVAIGVRTGRRVGVLHGLCWPALFTALAAPSGALGPSFCLSYAAVAGLALAGPPRNDEFAERWLLAPVRASLWATLTTAPLTLHWFGQIAPWTILLTPLLAPLVGSMLFLGLSVGLGSLAVPQLGDLLATPLQLLTASYCRIVAAADALPGTPWHALVAPPVPLLLAGLAAGVACCALVRGRRGIALACVCTCAPHFVPLRDDGPTLRLFAVGHGQACLVTYRDGVNVLLDCGSLQYATLPARKVERALRRRRIDLLVLTHADRDHTGAVVEVLRRTAITAAILPMALDGSAVHAALCAEGVDVELLRPGERAWPRAGLRIAAPSLDAPSTNDASLWACFDLGGCRVLATGDAEEAGVRAAIDQGVATTADVLILPHHGRANEEASALLRAVAPRTCLVSNRQGEGLSALGETARAWGIPTHATGCAGDLELRFDGVPRWASPRGMPLWPSRR